jgi:hypothetical protein
MTTNIQNIRKNLAQVHTIVNRNVNGVDIPLTSDELELWLDQQAEIMLANEHGWSEFRSKRDFLLSASDWTQVSDAPVDAKLWSAYRQELRDLPANVSDLTDPILWPEPPQ